MPWKVLFPQALVILKEHDAVVVTSSSKEKQVIEDPEIGSLIFKAIASESPQLRRLIVVEGSLFHAFSEELIELHKIS